MRYACSYITVCATPIEANYAISYYVQRPYYELYHDKIIIFRRKKSVFLFLILLYLLNVFVYLNTHSILRVNCDSKM